MSELLAAAGIGCERDTTRGWDHGVFVPLMLLFPAADVPLVQLSVLRSQDAASHLAYGAALAPLRDEGVLLLGSGVSFHNMRLFFGDAAAGRRHSASWDAWLRHAMTAPMDAEARTELLSKWADRAPAAREAHPPRAAEHLMPALVVAGAGMAAGGTAMVVGDSGGECSGTEEQRGGLLDGFAFSQFEWR